MATTYTVTATGTYFVTASNAEEALVVVYEAMLGNDRYGHRCLDILGNGEVHDDMRVQRGFHSTIPDSMYGLDNDEDED
jgi:hypothetical protein